MKRRNVYTREGEERERKRRNKGNGGILVRKRDR